MKLAILLDDPTCYGGMQQFSRDLAEMLGERDRMQVELLAYSGALSGLKACGARIVRLNEAEKRRGIVRLLRGGPRRYLSCGPLRLASLVLDIPQIRRRMREILPGGDVLLINSFHSAHLFVPRDVLKKNQVIFVQHSSPGQLYRWRYDFGGWLRRQKIELFKRYVDALVTLSPHEEAGLARYLSLDGKLVRVIRHQTRLPETETLESGDPREVLFLGRLSAEKRVDRILQLAAAAPQFHFHLCGDGPEEARLKRAAAGLTNVSFHGYVKDPSAWLRRAGIVIFTSDSEGYPIAGIEATAYGKPILALHSFPAAADLVVNGKNGCLLEDFTPEGFAAALEEIARNYSAYCAGALAEREKFSQTAFHEAWRTLLRDLSGKEMLQE